MKPIFTRQDNIEKVAFLNWRISKNSEILNLLNIADGYLLSSIELAKHCIDNNRDKRADIMIFPILTNANHGIELYLKAATWILNKLLNTDLRIEGSHNLKQIFTTVKAKIRKYNGQISLTEFENNTEGLWSYIVELFEKVESTEKDDKMDFSRYPFSNKYENHFYVDAIGNVEIDLENFISRFEEIRKNLTDLCDYLYHQELNREW